MKRLITILVAVLLFGCDQHEKNSDDQWKTIKVGDYLFDFPGDFTLVADNGIDSYVGKIKGESMSFGFDFGYYSNDFEQTLQEYLDNGDWRLALSYQFIKADITYDQTNMPKVDVLNIRQATIQDSTMGKGFDYVATCKQDTTKFDFPVYIPDEIKQLNFHVDTIDNQYRKIVWAKDPQNGTTGIYIRDLNSFDKTINSHLALSMATSKLTIEQQEIALKIFKTVRLKNETK